MRELNCAAKEMPGVSGTTLSSLQGQGWPTRTGYLDSILMKGEGGLFLTAHP